MRLQESRLSFRPPGPGDDAVVAKILLLGLALQLGDDFAGYAQG